MRTVIIFYSQGDTLFNANHQIAERGNGLISPNFFSSNISTIIPNHQDKYLVISATSTVSLSRSNIVFSIVNTDSIGRPAIDTNNHQKLLSANCTQQLAIANHINGQDLWLIVHKINSNRFISYLIDSTATFKDSVISDIGPLLGESEFGELKVSPCSEQFIFGRQIDNTLYLGKIDRSTGTITNLIPALRLENFSFSNSFSPSSGFLYGAYLSLSPFEQPAKTRGRLFQISANVFDTMAIRNSFQIIDTIPYYQWQSMQLGIDGKIYFCDVNFNISHMGVIHCPDQPGRLAQVQDSAIYMGRPTGRGLPVLNQTLFVNARLLQATPSRDTICAGDTVRIAAYGASAETFNWSLSVNGPSFSANNTITVNPQTTTTYYVRGAGRCSSKDTFVTVYVLPRPMANLSLDRVLCLGDSVVLNLLQQAGVRYSWACSFDGSVRFSASNSVIVRAGMAGLGYVAVLVSNGICTARDTIWFDVKPKPMGNLRLEPDSNLSVCSNEPVVLTAYSSGNLGIRWNTGDTSRSITATQTGRYEVRLRSAEGCLSDTSIGIDVSLNPLPPSVQISGPQFVCPGSSNVPYQVRPTEQVQNIKLHVIGDDSASFADGTIFINWGAANQNGQIMLVPINSFGCRGDSARLPINITRELRPQTTLFAGLNDSVCLANAQNLPYGIANHNPQSRYTWRTEPENWGTIANANQDSARITFLALASGEGWLRLSETDTTPIAQCFGETLYRIRIWPQPGQKPIQGFDSLCIGESKVQKISSEASGTFNWAASLGDILSQNSNQSQIRYTANFTPSQDFTPIILSATETSEKGCIGPQNEKILVVDSSPNPAPPSGVGQETLNWQTLNNQVYTTTGRPGSIFLWEAENGQITAGQGSKQIIVNWLPEQVLYSLKVTETTLIGCQSQSIGSAIDYNKTLFIPNVITPNSDGQNHVFEIKNLHFYPNSKLSIYNRWGREIFQTDNYQNTWNADQTGTYFFVLTVEGKVWKGVLSVVR